MPTSTTTDAMPLQFLQALSSYYKANSLKDVWIGSKLTGRIVNNHLSSCNMHQFKIVANDRSWFLVTPTGKTTDAIAMNFFKTPSFYYTSTVVKDIQVGIKMTKWWTIIWITVNSSDFKRNLCYNVAIVDLQYLVTPTS